MNTLAAEAVLALLLLIIGALGGYGYATHQGDKALGTAQSDLAVCVSASGAKQAAINDVQQQLGELKKRHDKMLSDGEAAIANRDAEIQDLQREAQAARDALNGAAHDDASCADLARLPICAAVAERLWPGAAASDGHHAP